MTTSHHGPTSEPLRGASRSSNPYHQQDGSLALRQSVVAFVDILGYIGMAKRAQQNNNEDEFLRELHLALYTGRQHLQIDQELPKWGKDLYVIKAFTDNIVIGWPIRDDAESELGSIFSRLAWFQLLMVNAGFFVRGAISVGGLFLDEIAVFGGGLTEAYEGESQLARDPRII